MHTIQLLIALSFCFLTHPALPSDSRDTCPFDSDKQKDYWEKVEAAISSAKTCDEARSLASNCGLGGAGDARLVGLAQGVCQKGLKLSKTDKKLSNALKKRCDEKFKGKNGSMYVAERAQCEAKVDDFFRYIYAPDIGG
jgi:hypothetical protein